VRLRPPGKAVACSGDEPLFRQGMAEGPANGCSPLPLHSLRRACDEYRARSSLVMTLAGSS
jgi:hypothetical protein